MMVNGYIQVRITSVGTKEPWKMPIHLNDFFGKGYNQRIYNEINLDLSLQQKLEFFD